MLIFFLFKYSDVNDVKVADVANQTVENQIFDKRLKALFVYTICKIEDSSYIVIWIFIL